MTTLQRIKQFTDFKGITNQAFEKSVGFSNGAFASQLKNNRTIGIDKLENILRAYPDVNPSWLLTGEGEMLKKRESSGKTSSNVADETRYSNNNDILIATQQKLIDLQDKTIIGLEHKIDYFKNKIRALELENTDLKEDQKSI